MKKLLVAGIVGAVLGTSAFAGGVTYLGKKYKTLSLQVKSIDIKDSGLDTSVIYGISYTFDKDLGGEKAWGLKAGLEFNYGKMDYSDNIGDVTYTEASFLIGPSYTFNCGAQVYLQAKAGYVGFSDSITSKSGTNGHVLAGVAGVEYPIKSFVVGAKAEVGKTYVDAESYSTTTFGGYVGYRF